MIRMMQIHILRRYKDTLTLTLINQDDIQKYLNKLNNKQ